VELFTRRQINTQLGESYKDAERLVALSRLARIFSYILKQHFQCEDEYVAGIWRGSLTQSLLWSVEKGLQQHPVVRWRKPESPRAPSWSWAAVEGSGFLEAAGNFQSRIRIREATIKPLNSHDRFGRVHRKTCVANFPACFLAKWITGQVSSIEEKDTVQLCSCDLF
jgi:hypothetical protein